MYTSGYVLGVWGDWGPPLVEYGQQAGSRAGECVRACAYVCMCVGCDRLTLKHLEHVPKKQLMVYISSYLLPHVLMMPTVQPTSWQSEKVPVPRWPLATKCGLTAIGLLALRKLMKNLSTLPLMAASRWFSTAGHLVSDISHMVLSSKMSWMDAALKSSPMPVAL